MAASGPWRATIAPWGSGPPRVRSSSTSTAAPIRFRTPSRPTRVGLRPTRSSRTLLPGTSAAATSRKGGRREVAGHGYPLHVQPLRGAHGDPPNRAASLRRHDPQLRDLDLGPGRGQQPLRVVASRGGLDHLGLALGEQAGDQHARLDLGAGDRKLVGDAAERRPLHAKRRQAAVAALDLGAHQPQGLGDPVHGAAPDRLVSVERPGPAALPRQPAGQDAKQGAGVLHLDRDRLAARGESLPRAAQPDPPHPQIAAEPAARSTGRAPRAPRRAPERRSGSPACPPRRGSPRSPSPPPPSPRSAPPGG